MKELVIFDVDNTIVCGQSQALLVSYLRKKKYIRFSTYIRLIVWTVLYKFGLVQNPLSAMQYGLVFIKQKTESEVSAIVEDFFQQILVHKFYPEAIKLIKDHQSNGRLVILVSNSPEVVVKKIATHLGIEQYLSTRLELINQLYTGKILGEIMYGKQKVISVNSYIQSRNLSLESSWGYGDHDSDIPVLQEVSHPFAVNPTSSLKKIALKNKWPILTFKL